MPTAAPSVVRLTFNEPVQPIGSGIRVVAPSGRRVERGRARASGPRLSVDVDTAEQGTYVVSWRVVAADTQPERGRFAFTVGRPTAAASMGSGDEQRRASSFGFALAVLGRALHFLGFALGFGSLVFRWLVLRPVSDAGAAAGTVAGAAASDRALWRLTRSGLAALLLAEPLVVLGQALRLGLAGDAEVLADVLDSRVGLVSGQRLGIALALWAMLTALESGSTLALKVALALGAGLAVIEGQAAHAMSVRPLAAGLVGNALHVAAMATWVGVVIALLAAWRLTRVAAVRAAIARRTGRVAILAGLVAIGSGALLSTQHLTEAGNLAATLYGRLIVAKLATLIVVVALAMAAKRRGRGAPARWWRAELAALVALLLLAALLVSLSPPA